MIQNIIFIVPDKENRYNSNIWRIQNYIYLSLLILLDVSSEPTSATGGTASIKTSSSSVTDLAHMTDIRHEY